MTHFKQLTRTDRDMIQNLLQQDHSLTSIAEILSVSKSTISRETRRGGMNSSNYCASKANAHAIGQRPLPPHRKPDELWIQVEERLIGEQWSPEQISGYRRENGLPTISTEAIYLHIYRRQDQGVDLTKHLRHSHRKRRKRRDKQDLRGSIKHRVSIDERPAEVEQKARLGDFELDTVVGPAGTPVLVTIVDRHSKYTLMDIAPSKGAGEVGETILALLKQHKGLVRTLTFDNGKEFAHHYLIDELLNSKSFFAHPYHSWERGLNENTNGLIRQYFPKKTDFSKITKEEVKRVQNLLNERPRKTLKYKTPNEIFLN